MNHCKRKYWRIKVITSYGWTIINWILIDGLAGILLKVLINILFDSHRPIVTTPLFRIDQLIN